MDTTIFISSTLGSQTAIETVSARSRAFRKRARSATSVCATSRSVRSAAQSVVDIASVQVSLSPLDDENLRNGVAEYGRDNGIRLIAYGHSAASA